MNEIAALPLSLPSPHVVAKTFPLLRLQARIFFFIIVLAPLVRVTSADTKPVSYYHDLLPIFKRSCQGCHSPGKLKGELDLTTVPAMVKGGKTGPAIVPSHPEKSFLIDQVSGDPPEMPKKGDPLSKEEIALLQRWISQGAKDDTPADKINPFKLSAPPEYAQPPVISAIAYSPKGEMLAVSGYHEVLLHHSDGSGIVARLVGESPRIESIAFAPDGKHLAASGGAPAVFGEIQIWDVSSHSLLQSIKIDSDTLYGVSFSPDGEKIAFGCADKTARIISAKDGNELLKFDNHSDWVFGTTWTVDGKRLLSGSRDRALKLISAGNGQFIDDINKLLEGVLCLARHPKEDQVAYGGDLGTPRIYRISDNQGRTAANNDVNLLREFERQPGPIHAIAFSPDGKTIAVGSASEEVRVYNVANGARVSTWKGQSGATFAVAFRPDGQQAAIGGYDGKVRLFEPATGKQIKEFVPVPLRQENKLAQSPVPLAR